MKEKSHGLRKKETHEQKLKDPSRESTMENPSMRCLSEQSIAKCFENTIKKAREKAKIKQHKPSRRCCANNSSDIIDGHGRRQVWIMQNESCEKSSEK